MKNSKLHLLLVLLLSTSIIILCGGFSKPQNKLDSVLTQDIGFEVKVESITKTELLLYDSENKIEINIPWYYDDSDLLEFRKSKWYYNYSTDTLYRVYKGKLYNMDIEL